MRPVEKPSADLFMRDLVARNPAEPEFHQAVQEVVESLVPVLDRHPEYRKAKVVPNWMTSPGFNC